MVSDQVKRDILEFAAKLQRAVLEIAPEAPNGTVEINGVHLMTIARKLSRLDEQADGNYTPEELFKRERLMKEARLLASELHFEAVYKRDPYDWPLYLIRVLGKTSLRMPVPPY